MESQSQRFSRANTITRDEYDSQRRSEKSRRPKDDGPRGRPPIRNDEKVAEYAAQRPTVIRGWLERVEGRFMGTPQDISPEDALLLALSITTGEVRYCDAQIARLTEDELFERPERSVYAEMPSGHWEMVEERRDAEVISRWQTLRRDAMDRMARYAKMAIDVGLEAKNQQIREKQATLIAKFFEAVMGEIELTADQQNALGPALRRHLEIVESTAEEMP